MALSYVTYTGNGSTQTYAVPFGFIDEAHVTVTLDGTPTTAFSWVSAGSITFNSAPASAVVIKIARDTPNDILVNIQPKARVKSSEINLVFTQARYIAEEAYDNAVKDTAGPAAAAAASAAAAAISEANAASSDSSAQAALAAAIAARDAALAAQSGAEAAETVAVSAKDTAVAASSSATAAELAAIQASSDADAAKNTAVSSASAAASSESAASASASSASASESAAASSASSASSSATVASNAATTATDARDQTLAAYDNFDDRYLGAKASAPTLDNDGQALIAGALYFNTTSDAMFVYTGSGWVAAYVTGGDGYLSKTGGTMTGSLILAADPSGALEAATKQYVDTGLAGKAASSHTHTIADVTNLQATLDGKQPAGSYAAASHTHTIANVTNLQTTLDGKQPLDADLTAISSATLTGDGHLIRVSGAWFIDTTVYVSTTGTQTLTNKTLTNPTIDNYTEGYNTVASQTAYTVNLSNGTIHFVNTGGNCTITLPAPVIGKSFTVVVDYGGAHTLTWAGGGTIHWPGGTVPTPTSTTGALDIYTFVQDGTYTYGAQAGANFS